MTNKKLVFQGSEPVLKIEMPQGYITQNHRLSLETEARRWHSKIVYLDEEKNLEGVGKLEIIIRIQCVKTSIFKHGTRISLKY